MKWVERYEHEWGLPGFGYPYIYRSIKGVYVLIPAPGVVSKFPTLTEAQEWADIAIMLGEVVPCA